MNNPNCDGYGPCRPGQVRRLPTGGDGAAILCAYCYAREIKFRRERNVELEPSARFPLPAWSSLKVYGEDEPRPQEQDDGTRYDVFHREFWRVNAAWPMGREPHAGERTYIGHNLTREAALDMCREWNATNEPGNLSRKAEFEEA